MDQKCGYCHRNVEDVIEHRANCDKRIAYMKRSTDKVVGAPRRHLAAVNASPSKGKFVFMPVKKQPGREATPTIMAAITKTGGLYLGNSVLERLGVKPFGVVMQILADYEKRAIAFKILTEIKMGDENTVEDSSIRFLKPSVNAKSGQMILNVLIQKLLKSMGYKIGTSERIEIQQYSDSWTKDVWYFEVPKQNHAPKPDAIEDDSRELAEQMAGSSPLD